MNNRYIINIILEKDYIIKNCLIKKKKWKIFHGLTLRETNLIRNIKSYNKIFNSQNL